MDIGNAPVLMKTKGKTTTDDISPAGSWLRFRGHLDRFSDNLLLTAVNAYNGKRGTTIDVLSGEADQKIPVVARNYQAQGMPWVIVGDANYGEGSEPRARRADPASPRRRRGHRAQLRADPRVEPEEAGTARADVQRSGGLRQDPRRRPRIVDRPLGPDAGQARDMPGRRTPTARPPCSSSSTRSRPRRSSGSGRARR